MEKKCFKCKKIKPLDTFYKHPDMPDGTVNKCKECNKRENNENRIKKRQYYLEYDKNRYRLNIDRILMTRYLGMRDRVFIQRESMRSSFGKEICSIDEFLDWSKQPDVKKKFMQLYNKWRKNNYIRKLSPSIDRISNDKGYTLENMQWITQQQNSSKH